MNTSLKSPPGPVSEAGIEWILTRALRLPPARLALMARRIARLRVNLPKEAGIARLDDRLTAALEHRADLEEIEGR